MNWIEAQGVLNANKDKEIYYHTDSRWTTLGASLVWQQIASDLGLDTSKAPALKPYVVTGDFSGNLSRTSGFESGYREPVSYTHLDVYKRQAVICVGAVIRGDTSHYDLVCNESAKGIAQIELATGIPVLFGIITTENIEQAIARAGSKAGNKGYDCALSAIEMVNLIKQL